MISSWSKEKTIPFVFQVSKWILQKYPQTSSYNDDWKLKRMKTFPCFTLLALRQSNKNGQNTRRPGENQLRLKQPDIPRSKLALLVLYSSYKISLYQL